MDFAGASPWQVKRKEGGAGWKNEVGDGIFFAVVKGEAVASHAGKIPAQSQLIHRALHNPMPFLAIVSHRCLFSRKGAICLVFDKGTSLVFWVWGFGGLFFFVFQD